MTPALWRRARSDRAAAVVRAVPHSVPVRGAVRRTAARDRSVLLGDRRHARVSLA